MGKFHVQQVVHMLCELSKQNKTGSAHQLIASSFIALLASLLCPRNSKPVPQKRKGKII